MERRTSRYAGMTLRVVEDVGLTVIGIATIVAAWQEASAASLASVLRLLEGIWNGQDAA